MPQITRQISSLFFENWGKVQRTHCYKEILTQTMLLCVYCQWQLPSEWETA